MDEYDDNAAGEAAHAAFTTGPRSKTTPAERAEIMLHITEENEVRAFPNGQGESLVLKDPIGVCSLASNHSAPFGGRNDSGLGIEYGPAGLTAYLSYKSIHGR